MPDLSDLAKQNSDAIKALRKAKRALEQLPLQEDPAARHRVTAELAGLQEEIVFREERQGHLDAGTVTIQPLTANQEAALDALAAEVDAAIHDDARWNAGLDMVLGVLSTARSLAVLIDKKAPNSA